jgi:aryl-alcohol dehydrogenase-like predicted oxidoreductase
MGLGLAALGRPGYMTVGHASDFARGRGVEAMREQAHAVMSEAYALGIRYFDVARSYGLGEEFVASWRAPSDAVIGSKWGYTYTADWKTDASVHEVKDHSIAAFERQWAETRAVLGDRVCLYQIHSATLETGVLEDARVLGALMRLRSNGVRIGLSVTGPKQPEIIRKAISVRVDGVALFQCVQATWNLLERSAGPALNEAHDAGLGVIVKEALSNGRLTVRGGFGDEAVALAAVLAQPFVDVVLSGATTGEQLRSNVRAFSVDGDAALRSITPQPPAEYWGERSRLSWT